MTWKELKNGEWKATGKEGEFWLWKSGRQWTGAINHATAKSTSICRINPCAK